LAHVGQLVHLADGAQDAGAPLAASRYPPSRCETSGAGTAAARVALGPLTPHEPPLIRSLGPIAGRDIERLHARLALAGDARDLLAARDSLAQLLGLSQLDA
jgi:hypothetical protein